MHELSLAGGILRLVEQTAERDPFERVRRLRLSVPALAGVEVRALRFALESIAPGTLIASATIDIDEPPGQAWCMSCCTSVSSSPTRTSRRWSSVSTAEFLLFWLMRSQ